MEKLNGELLASDVVVFVTPLYYYTFTAQIKAVMDRFHASNAKLVGNKKAILMATSYGDKIGRASCRERVSPPG